MAEVIKTKFDGRKALIIGENHPHRGYVCECLGAEWISGLGRYGMKFRNGELLTDFFVLDGKEVSWVSS